MAGERQLFYSPNDVEKTLDIIDFYVDSVTESKEYDKLTLGDLYKFVKHLSKKAL